MKLSIIIPVYRVENTLDRCVESVLCQTYDDWEMLLIDDGSPDSCPAKCDEWASRDSRITALHKTNGGLSDARNYGLTHAKGNYVTFIDSDDTISADTLMPLMQLLCADESIGVVEYSVIVHQGHPSAYTLALPDCKWQSARQYWHATTAWNHCYACNKIFRMSLFRNVSFPKDRVFEDVWIWPQILSDNPTILTTSQGFYQYIWNDNGITVNASVKELYQLLQAQIRAAILMRTTPFAKCNRQLYRSMLCRLYDILRFSMGAK